jgi:hypothetical protein
LPRSRPSLPVATRRVAQTLGHREHPSPNRQARDDVVGEMSGGLDHTAGISRRADAPPQEYATRKSWPQPAQRARAKAMGKDAAFEIAAEFPLDVGRCGAARFVMGQFEARSQGDPAPCDRLYLLCAAISAKWRPRSSPLPSAIRTDHALPGACCADRVPTLTLRSRTSTGLSSWESQKKVSYTNYDDVNKVSLSQWAGHRRRDASAGDYSRTG